MPPGLVSAEEDLRLAWLASNILPLEGELRHWLSRHVRGLRRSDIDDIIQESYSKLLSAAWRDIGNPRAFFYMVARNVVLMQVRHARVVPMERLGDLEALRISSDEPGPERRVSAREELDRLLRAVAALPKQARRVFEMRKLHGVAQKDVATRLGLSEKTVENNLARALKHVLECLTEADSVRVSGGSKTSDSADRGRRPA